MNGIQMPSSTGVLFSVVPSSRIISRLSTSNSGSVSDCGFLFRLSDDLRDNCVFWRSSKSSGSSSENVMKQPNLILSLMIPGPKAPENKIDVYMQPLKKELKDLWGGIETFDAYARENFKLKAAVLSTISDFPRDIRSFDGNEDLRHAPIPHSRDDVLNIIENIDLNNKNDFRGPWKKKSIFFELPYWKGLLLPHNLDVMHIEKNLNKRKLIGMKSYGCHMLMQEYLPIALCGTFLDLVRTVLIELWNTKISSKENIGYVGYLSLSLNRFIASDLVNGLESGGVVVTILDSSNTQEVLSYYRSLKEVVKLNYSGKIRVVLFKCDWVDVNKGCKRDKFGIKLVNFSHLTHSGSDTHDDQFIFASQVDKVFYAKDPRLEGWLVVRHVKVKDAFNMRCNSDENNLYSIPDTCDVPSLHRNEVDGDDKIDVTESIKVEEEEEEDTY
nr:hypothetical protein [Tanacetum cinerariifolium]